MIFVTGGAYSGKETCARELLNISDSDWDNYCVRGGVDISTQAFINPYVVDYHILIRDLVNQHRDPEAFTNQLIESQPQLVVMDEAGCGVMPVTKRDLDYREAVGHCGQMLADAATEVYYVVCGICMRIK